MEQNRKEKLLKESNSIEISLRDPSYSQSKLINFTNLNKILFKNVFLFWSMLRKAPNERSSSA